MVFGFIPFFSLTSLSLFLLVCLFRVNLTAFFLSSALFSLMAWGLDPVFDRLGFWLLVELPILTAFWADLFRQPLLPFFQLNNTLYLGSLVLGLVLSLPVFVGLIFLIRAYRKRWREKIKTSSWFKALKTSKIYSLYQKFRALEARWGQISS